MPPRLDLAKVLAGAFLVPWWRRRAFVRALAIPVALIFAYTVLWQAYVAPRLGWLGGWASVALYGLLFSLFAVRCHRLVLLEADWVAQDWRFRWTLRETRFFMWVAGFWLIGGMALLVVLTLAVNLWQWLSTPALDETQVQWAQRVVGAALLYPFGRLSPMFPATAVDQEPAPDLRWAWRLTRGNGWRLFVVVGVLPWLFALLVDLVYRSEATTVEWLLVCLLFTAFLAVEIAAVSLCYRELMA